MRLGLAHYVPADLPLARLIGATVAQVRAELDDPPDLTDLCAHCADNGLSLVVDASTHLETLCRCIYSGGKVTGSEKTALAWYTDRVLALLERHPTVRDVEVWGDADIPYIVPGVMPVVNYGGLLSATFAAVKAARPDVRVWTGGFGPNCTPQMLQQGISVHAPHAFDVLNWYPFLSSCGDPEADVDRIGQHLDIARAVLEQRCDDQPFAASAFGVPTTTLGYCPPLRGRFYQAPHTHSRVIPEEDAHLWYQAMLGLFAERGFETVCLLARDFVRPPDQRPGVHEYSGLVGVDGREKAFVRPLSDWLHEKLQTGA